MIFKNLWAVECACKLQVREKEVDRIPSLELLKPSFTICAAVVAKVISYEHEIVTVTALYCRRL